MIFNTSALPKNSKLSDSDFRVGLVNQSEAEPMELLVYDAIGDAYEGGVSASAVSGILNANPQRDVLVRINSGGGLAFDGISIYNALKMHAGTVTTRVDGLAFSAASIIAMAGDSIQIHESATIGIHRAMGLAFGNVDDARGLAEWLDQLDGQLVSMYTARTGLPESDVRAYLVGTSDGTTFAGQQAVDAGFADELIENKKPYEEENDSAMAASRSRLVASIRVKELTAQRFSARLGK